MLQKSAALAPSWESVLDVYLTFHKLKGLSPATLQWRSIILKMFLHFHSQEGLACSPADCSPEHVQSYLWWVRQRGVRPATMDAHYRILRALFNWMVREGLRSDNPVLKVPRPQVDAPMPRTVTEEHLVAVLRALKGEDFATLRNRALFLLAFDSGARVSELLNLRVGDIDFLQRTAIVRGKGGRERLIFFGAATAQALVRYLTKRTLLFGELTPESYLFISVDGGKMTRNAVLRCWRRAQRRAGVKMLPFHGLRHGFARAWLLSGGDAFSLQLLLGHRSSATTQRYVTLWGHDLQRMHRERSPVDRLLSDLRRRNPLPL